MTDVLTMETEHVCGRHSIRTGTGFAISLSCRGKDRYAPLKEEATAFTEGVQVPR